MCSYVIISTFVTLLLLLTGVINTTVGMKETDGEIYDEIGSWDGDVLANIGVGFGQVQGEKPR